MGSPGGGAIVFAFLRRGDTDPSSRSRRAGASTGGGERFAVSRVALRL